MSEEYIRKRSRSPTDSLAHPPQNKRANTGTSSPRSKPTSSTMNGNDNSITPPHRSPNRSSNGDAGSSNRPQSESGRPTDSAPPPLASIHMRCLIVTSDASIIIGRNGTHVNEIRSKSGARVVVSESKPGNPERILNVSGPLDAVSKAFGLIVRRINDEPFDVASVPGSRAVTIKFMIPNSRMGSVIGKAGSKIKEIQDASGARLNASEGMLPGSTERVLSVAGVADAIHIATYYIGNILLESAERASHRSTYRPSSTSQNRRSGATPTGSSYTTQSASQPYNSAAGVPSQSQTLYIPNDLVGCIIGKGGSKINEIRQKCQAQIRIMEPGATAPGSPAPPSGGENERLVIITGAPSNIQMAVQLLYTRLEEEKEKHAAAAAAANATA